MKMKRNLFTTALLASLLIMSTFTTCAGLGTFSAQSGVSGSRRAAGNASQDGPTAEEWNVPPPEPPGMVLIKGGTFMMGQPVSELDVHQRNNLAKVAYQFEATVSSFYMGRYPVTVKEYREIMGAFRP